MKALIWLGLVCLSFATASLAFGGYDDMTAFNKLQHLWFDKIIRTEYKKLPGENRLPTACELLATRQSLKSLDVSFTHVSDEIPKGRYKFIHTYGSVARIEYISVPGHRYTGIFETGAIGLARLGLAGPPRYLGYTPGMAIKFLRDGYPSANMHVMYSLDGQGKNRNFFANTFSNLIEPPRNPVLKPLVKVFQQFVSNPFHLQLDHVAERDRYGIKGSHVAAPEQLLFVPTCEVGIDPSSKTDYRNELARIPEGTTLYDVYAVDPANDGPQLIGKLVSRSRFVASEWGDKNLFFQHHSRTLKKREPDRYPR